MASAGGESVALDLHLTDELLVLGMARATWFALCSRRARIPASR